MEEENRMSYTMTVDLILIGMICFFATVAGVTVMVCKFWERQQNEQH
jgi:hypothetical protein